MAQLFLLLITILQLSIKCSSLDVNQLQQTISTTHLDLDLQPINYVIELTPYFDDAIIPNNNFTFDGHIQITIQTALTDRRNITLHTKNLQINESLTILHESGDQQTRITIENTIYNPQTNFYTLNLLTPLKSNIIYLLQFTYTGLININEPKGFYASSYTENNIQKWIALTKLMPIYAREVFPCFDEPAFKATFVLKINRLNKYITTLSNTKLESNLTIDENHVRDIFKRTPIMSTFSLNFLISEFKNYIENIDQQTINIHSDRENLLRNYTEYGLLTSQRILTRLSDLFGESYFAYVEKMDLIIVDNQTLENLDSWGLTSVSEYILPYDPTFYSTANDQQKILTSLTYSHVKIWFDHLISTSSWSFNGIHKGFARYFEYFGAAGIEPTWELQYQYVIDLLHPALYADSINELNSIIKDVNTPEDITNLYKSIPESKASAIIRMTEYLIGTNNFNEILRDYVKLGSNTTISLNLFYELIQNKTDKINVTTFMNDWTLQSGYPVISVTVKDDQKSIEISQKQFFVKNITSTTSQKWIIPLTYTDNNTLDFSIINSINSLIFPSDQQSISLTLPKESDWIIFNIQQIGFYRVNYDGTTWNNLAKALKQPNHSGIHVLNRAQILDDVMNLAQAGSVNYTTAFNIIQYLENETNYIPWKAAANNWNYIFNRLKSNQLDLAKKYILDITENEYKKVTFEVNSQSAKLDIYQQLLILKISCKYGRSECISKSLEIFRNFQNNGIKISANIRSIVFCTAITDGDSAEWEFLWNQYQVEYLPAEKLKILSALGCTKNRLLIQKYFQLILSADIRKVNEKLYAITAIGSQQSENVEILFDLLINNFQNISNLIPRQKTLEIIAELANRFVELNQIKKLEEFLERNKNEFSIEHQEILVNAISQANYNLKWADDNIPVIYEYMRQISVSATMKLSSILLISTTFLYYLLF